MRAVLFWGITQRRMVNPYRRFRTTYPSHHQGQEIREILWFLTDVSGLGPVAYVRITTLRCVISQNSTDPLDFFDFLILEDDTERLFRNVDKELPLYAA